MTITITLIVSLCSHLSTDQIQARVQELQSRIPEAKVSVRFSKKACEK